VHIFGGLHHYFVINLYFLVLYVDYFLLCVCALPHSVMCVVVLGAVVHSSQAFLYCY